MADYLLLENGVDRILLEDGASRLELEAAPVAGPLPDYFVGTSLQAGYEDSAPIVGTSLPTVGSGVASGAAVSALWGSAFDTGSNPYV